MSHFFFSVKENGGNEVWKIILEYTYNCFFSSFGASWKFLKIYYLLYIYIWSFIWDLIYNSVSKKYEEKLIGMGEEEVKCFEMVEGEIHLICRRLDALLWCISLSFLFT